MLLLGLAENQPSMMPQLLGLSGLGNLGYSDSTLCSDIPAGDPYRSSGNYCTQPSGNVMEFNADGSIDPDPYGNAVAPGGAPATPGSGGSTSWWQDALSIAGGAASSLLKSQTPKGAAPVATPWYTTPLGIGGIALGVLGLVFILKRI